MKHEHKPGERIEIRWPGAPYNFVIEYDHTEPVTAMPGWEDWIVLNGLVVEPDPGVRRWQSFYVHPVEGTDDDGEPYLWYELLPVNQAIKTEP